MNKRNDIEGVQRNIRRSIQYQNKLRQQAASPLTYFHKLAEAVKDADRFPVEQKANAVDHTEPMGFEFPWPKLWAAAVVIIAALMLGWVGLKAAQAVDQIRTIDHNRAAQIESAME